LAEELGGLKAMISGGVVYSLPGQKGQNPPFFLCEAERKSVGLFPRSIDMITHLPTMGSFLSSGIYPPFIAKKGEKKTIFPHFMLFDFGYYIMCTNESDIPSEAAQ
jgi:hypothetical protein